MAAVKVFYLHNSCFWLQKHIDILSTFHFFLLPIAKILLRGTRPRHVSILPRARGFVSRSLDILSDSQFVWGVCFILLVYFQCFLLSINCTPDFSAVNISRLLTVHSGISPLCLTFTMEWHYGIALPTPFEGWRCSISVTWYCDHRSSLLGEEQARTKDVLDVDGW